MTSLSSVNNAALLILQQPVSSSTSTDQSAAQTDIVKIANGVSSEASTGTKSAAAAIGKFAVDTAPTTGGIIMGGLGSADSFGELRELVNNNDKFSDAEKKGWLAKIDEMEEIFASVEELRASELFTAFETGKISRPSLADIGHPISVEEATSRLEARNTLLVSLGYEPLHESMRDAHIRSMAG